MTNYYILNVQISFHILKAMKQVGSFLALTYHLFYGLKPHLLFSILWKLIEELKIISRVFEMDPS